MASGHIDAHVAQRKEVVRLDVPVFQRDPFAGEPGEHGFPVAGEDARALGLLADGHHHAQVVSGGEQRVQAVCALDDHGANAGRNAHGCEQTGHGMADKRAVDGVLSRAKRREHLLVKPLDVGIGEQTASHRGAEGLGQEKVVHAENITVKVSFYAVGKGGLSTGGRAVDSDNNRTFVGARQYSAHYC